MTPFTALNAAERRTVREMALLNIAAPLLDEGGPLILPLTPWHHLMLSGHGNPVFCGGEWGVPEALQYLWLCSPQFFEMAGAKRPAHTHISAATAAWRTFRRRLFFMRWRRFVSCQGEVTPSVREAIIHHVWQFAFDQLQQPKLVEKSNSLRKPRSTSAAARFHEINDYEAVCRQCLRYTTEDFWHRPYIATNALISIVLGGNQDESVPKFDSERDAAVKAWLRARRQKKSQPESN